MKLSMMLFAFLLLFPHTAFGLNRGALGVLVDALEPDGRSDVTESICVKNCVHQGYDLSGCQTYCANSASIYTDLPNRHSATPALADDGAYDVVPVRSLTDIIDNKPASAWSVQDNGVERFRIEQDHPALDGMLNREPTYKVYDCEQSWQC